MRLGTETGSLINHLYSNAALVGPTVGRAATVLAWTDRYAGTITSVGLDGSFVVQEDKADRIDDNWMSEAQSYVYEADPNGRLFRFAPVLRGKAKGQIREGGKKNGYAVLVGTRAKYHDFSF